ncbi:Imm50 family immunity protein [Streptomyces sp. SYSU K217416]
MNASDWPEFLAHPGAIRELYETPPPLESCDLFYLHIDERQTSVTLGFDTRHLPTTPHTDGQEQHFNMFEFYLEFKHVTDLRIAGWTGQPHHDFSLTRQEGDRIAVSLRSAGQSMTLLARKVSLAHSRAYLAGSL